MARINLLPWREERRKQRQQEFYVLLGVAAVAAVLTVLAALWFIGTQVDAQTERNQILTREITALDAQIKEIEELDRQRDRLIARKEIIEQLQATRSQMVHLFDELVRTLPDGVQLSSIKQSGATLTLEGVAQSNARVSAYMRNLDASAWLKESEIIKIEARGDDKNVPYVFSLKVNLEDPNKKDDGAEMPMTTAVGGLQR
ncbi:MAG: PilN domain-containing protein [Xanthomonadales bacterium]|nr:PilN domain-containing protein [Xanthomonadales bacterium]MCB1610938.1 PilN domain-containing protein [Xanthomonadales bacterium]